MLTYAIGDLSNTSSLFVAKHSLQASTKTEGLPVSWLAAIGS